MTGTMQSVYVDNRIVTEISDILKQKSSSMEYDNSVHYHHLFLMEVIYRWDSSGVTNESQKIFYT